MTCGDPLLAATQQGAQCNEAQFKLILSYIDIGKTEAELVAGGTADTSGTNGQGLFIRPTIFSNVPDTARIAQEEIFGPVLSCTPLRPRRMPCASPMAPATALPPGFTPAT